MGKKKHIDSIKNQNWYDGCVGHANYVDHYKRRLFFFCLLHYFSNTYTWFNNSTIFKHKCKSCLNLTWTTERSINYNNHSVTCGKYKWSYKTFYQFPLTWTQFATLSKLMWLKLLIQSGVKLRQSKQTGIEDSYQRLCRHVFKKYYCGCGRRTAHYTAYSGLSLPHLH